MLQIVKGICGQLIQRVHGYVCDRPLILFLVYFLGAVSSVVLIETAHGMLARIGFVRHSILLFRIDYVVAFFFLCSLFLVTLSFHRPTWRSERYFFRFVVAIWMVGALWDLVTFSERKVVYLFFYLSIGCFIAWVLLARCINVLLLCVLSVGLSLIVPVDIYVTLPTSESVGFHPSVNVLEAQYGLVRSTPPGTFSMGCEVRVNPLKWILQVKF